MGEGLREVAEGGARRHVDLLGIEPEIVGLGEHMLEAPLGWLRDAVMGPAHRVPLMRGLMGSTLAGTRRGWFSATPLGDDGCFPLDV